jgi:hypothetical protein
MSNFKLGEPAPGGPMLDALRHRACVWAVCSKGFDSSVLRAGDFLLTTGGDVFRFTRLDAPIEFLGSLNVRIVMRDPIVRVMDPCILRAISAHAKSKIKNCS